jgi:hypothetical protein
MVPRLLWGRVSVTDARPEPLVPHDVDCRDLDGFMLNVERLLASELWALSNGDEFKAAVGLWARSWKQVPAASLPNDDRILASFAGMPVAKFRKVREMAMRGFVECSDGRFYHRVLAAEAVRAWGRKNAYQVKREADRKRLTEWREKRAAKPNGDGGETLDETRFVAEDTVRYGTGHSSDPNGSGGKPPNPVKALFDFGVSVLTAAKVPEQQARGMLGKWRKTLHDDGKLMALLVSAEQNHAIEPLAYLQKSVASAEAKARHGSGYVPPGVGG